MLIDKTLLNKFQKTKSVQDLNTLVEELLKDLGLQINVVGKIPSDKPLLLISNHPGAIDSFILASFANRTDQYFVGIEKFKLLGEAVKKTLLPVYSSPKIDEKLLNIILKLMGVDLGEQLSPEKMREKNRETISSAAELVSNGKMVSIFPAGSGGKSVEGGQWKAGVGFLAKQIKNPKTEVVFAHLIGTSPTDYLIFAGQLIRKLFYHPQPITIKFSAPVLLSTLIDKKMGGKEIAVVLEKKYNSYFSA